MRARSIVLTTLLAIAMVSTTSCGDCGDPSETAPGGGTGAEKAKATPTCSFLLNAIEDLVREINRLDSIPNTLDSDGGTSAIDEKCDDLKAGVDLYNREKCAAKLPSTPKACK